METPTGRLPLDELLNPTCTSLEDWYECCCGVDPSMNVLRHMFAVLLQYAFSDPDRLANFNSELSCLSYDPTKQAGTLAVEAGSTIDPGNSENVPGIRVNTETVTFDKAYGIEPISSRTPDTSGDRFSYPCKTVISVVCKHKDADVCVYLSDFVTLFLVAQYNDLKERFKWLVNYYPVEQGAATMKKAEGDSATYWYESTVKIGVDFVYSLFVARESKRLKDATVIADARGLRTPREHRRSNTLP